MKKILFITAECAPFAKAGGLADVSASLPDAIQGYEIRTIFPLYNVIEESLRALFTPCFSFSCCFDGKERAASLCCAVYHGRTFYAIDAPEFFGEDTCGKLYLDAAGDNRRFLFFCRALLTALPLWGFRPDLLHLNDWHTSFLSMMLKQEKGSFFRNTKTLLTIHNIGCMGITRFPMVWRQSGFPLTDFLTGPFSWRVRNSNPLKAGILTADYLTTVSPSYASELTTDGPDKGNYLARCIRSRSGSLTGIRNGIDTELYNPQTDPAIPCRYSIKEAERGKALCKRSLQERFGLAADPDVLLCAMVSRFCEQKGSSLTCACARNLLQAGAPVQFVFLGSGNEPFLTEIRSLVNEFPGRAAAMLQFSQSLPPSVYAGADVLLMPSLYEPCGLGQLIAMRYGTVPVVRNTGGLHDTVVPFTASAHQTDPTSRFPHSADYGCAQGYGFLFDDYSAEALEQSLTEALSLYLHEKACWRELVARCMAYDSSWKVPAAEYRQLYDRLTA